MAIPDSFIQELLVRVDVVELVGRYVPLKKTGANFAGLCPFHAEKSPSFTVSPSKQFFHCFGCGKHGNAIGFLMEHAGMGFVEAVKDLAGQLGLPMPEDERSPADRARALQQREKQATLTQVLEQAGEAYREHLRNTPRAIAYLKGRGLSGAVAKRFGLGYAPEGWRSLASVFPRYDDPLLAESGLVVVHEEDDKRYDRFRDRIMFPIRNVKGECIGFGARVLDGREQTGPKYLNSPETPVFNKGRELYGLFEARQALREHGFALVTEGYMDVVALAQLGFPNAVATLGTACTTDHVQKLFRFTDSVVFSFDGDAAGRRAARKALEGALPYASDLRSVKFLFLPPQHDPDSFIREHGADAFARYMSEASPLSRFLVDSAREGCDLSTAEGRAHMAANAKPLWNLMPDGALKRQLLAEIAELAQLDARDLSALWTGRPHSPSTARRQRPRTPRRAAGGRTPPPGRADRMLQIMLLDSRAWGQLSHDDHHMLCELPAPHGPLFTWLDARMQDEGPQPWSALRPTLAGHEHEEFAVDLLNRLPPEVENDPAELAHILERERTERRNEEMKALSLRAPTDPAAYERLKELVAKSRSKSGRPS